VQVHICDQICEKGRSLIAFPDFQVRQVTTPNVFNPFLKISPRNSAMLGEYSDVSAMLTSHVMECQIHVIRYKSSDIYYYSKGIIFCCCIAYYTYK